MEPEAERLRLPLCAARSIAVNGNRLFTRGSWFSRTRGKPLPGWAGELGISSCAQFALKWTESNLLITSATPETSKACHMHDNMLAGIDSLPD